MKLPHLNSALAKGSVERRPFANMMDLHKFLIQSLDNKTNERALYKDVSPH